MAETGSIDAGRVVQRGFVAIRRNAPGFLLLSLLVAGLPSFLVSYATLTGDDADSSGSTYGLGTFLSTVCGYILQAALARSTVRDLSGVPADLRGSLLAALRLLLPIVGLAIVSGIAIAFGLVLLIVPGIIFYVMWIVSLAVMIEERRGVFDSLSRSAELTKGTRWKVFALVLVYFVLWGLIAAVFALFAPADAMNDPASAAMVEGGASTVMGLLMGAMVGSLYLELRMVKEGASADSLAAVFA